MGGDHSVACDSGYIGVAGADSCLECCYCYTYVGVTRAAVAACTVVTKRGHCTCT